MRRPTVTVKNYARTTYSATAILWHLGLACAAATTPFAIALFIELTK
jgi:hypothetical protein